jgi:murein DD-endopeptidase MepM/ murein hydrolase activator NlpD
MKRIFSRKRRDYRLYAAAIAFGFTATLAALFIGPQSEPATQQPAPQIALQSKESSSTVTFAYASQAANNIFRPIQDALRPVEATATVNPTHFLGTASKSAPRQLSMTEVVKINKGDTLGKIFGAFDIPRELALQAVDSLKGIFSPRNFRVGQQITLLFRPTDAGERQFRGYRFAADPLRDVIVLDTNGTGKFDATVIEKKLTTVTVAKQGPITTSLIGSGARAGVPHSILAEMIRVYSYSVDFQRDIHEGDKFEVMYQAKIDEKGDVYDTGDMTYARLTLGGKHETIYRFEDSYGNVDYYKEDGQTTRRSLIRTPIDGARITSGFGFRRHPILGYNKQHKGIDFGARKGTPIYAAGNGTLAKVGWVNGYGNYIKINHNGSLATAYGHMSRFAKGMRPGVRVKQGQVIGYVGATGRATGPHLHYEVVMNGAQVNPMSVKVPNASKLAGNDLKKFKAITASRATQFRQVLIASRDKVASR